MINVIVVKLSSEFFNNFKRLLFILFGFHYGKVIKIMVFRLLEYTPRK